jgi:hypothetical protein
MVRMVPELCRKIVMFSFYFTQKANDKKELFNNPKWKIVYYGYSPTLMAMQFSKKMFNPSVAIDKTFSA